MPTHQSALPVPVNHQSTSDAGMLRQAKKFIAIKEKCPLASFQKRMGLNDLQRLPLHRFLTLWQKSHMGDARTLREGVKQIIAGIITLMRQHKYLVETGRKMMRNHSAT